MPTFSKKLLSDIFGKPEFDVDVLKPPLDRFRKVFVVDLRIIHWKASVTKVSASCCEYDRKLCMLAQQHDLLAYVAKARDTGDCSSVQRLLKKINSYLNRVAPYCQNVNVGEGGTDIGERCRNEVGARFCHELLVMVSLSQHEGNKPS